MKYVFIPRPYDNQETMHEEESGGLHSGGSLNHRRTHPRMVCAQVKIHSVYFIKTPFIKT